MAEVLKDNLITEPPQTEKPAGGRVLIDCRPIKLQVIEGAEGKGKVVVRGEFARCNIATENNRVYPKQLWEREFRRLDRTLKERKVYGHLDHPSDGRTSLAHVSHVMTDLRIEDGIVVGEAEVLDTEKGKTLKALLKAGCQVGVSSRGYGSTKMDESGKDIVQDDYRLVTFDFVAEPADSNAYPDVFFESKEQKKMSEKSQDDVSRKLDDARKEERVKVKAELEVEMMEALTKAKAELKDEVRTELLKDPEVAGAKTALESICGLLKPYGLSEEDKSVLAKKDEEIAALKKSLEESGAKVVQLESDLGKVTASAREAAYQFFLEKSLSGNSDADLVRKLLGNVNEYKDLDALKTKLESVVKSLSKKQESRAESAKKTAQLVESFEKKIEDLQTSYEGKVAKLQEALEKSLEMNKELGLRAYINKKLVGNPKSEKLRPMLESVKVETKSDVDKILEKFESTTNDSESLEAARSRVRKVTRGGLTTTPQDEETPRKRLNEDFNGTGRSIDDLLVLSGIK